MVSMNQRTGRAEIDNRPSADRRRVATNQYIYPSAPFAQGEDVIVKALPDDPNVVMIFGRP
jgi:hypothetical protein